MFNFDSADSIGERMKQTWPFAKKETYIKRQNSIREIEWKYVEKAIKSYLPGRFLDIGCGSGIVILKAEKLGFDGIGIDPNCKNSESLASSGLNGHVIRGVAEDLPFSGGRFDVVFSSHSLEHFQDRDHGLREMSRVVKEKGIAIIIVPTGTMAFVNLITQLMFTTHIRIGRFLLKERSLRGFTEIFFPMSHGSYKESVIQEIWDFRRNNWIKLISKYFEVREILLPGLYPYPNFPQIFPYFKSDKFSSSFIFVCQRLR
jgi:ubiquinone/menaquinone biosynthesis C-methylase UbiE